MDSLIPRNAHNFAVEVLEAFPAVVLQGARQVGKSTFAAQLTRGRSSRIATLDDPLTLSAAREDPTSFVEQLPDGLLVIDELQRAPELILPIKASIDRDRRPGRFLLTGSSDLLAIPQTPDSLAGRAITVQLWPFSQGEIAGVKEDFASRARAGVDAWSAEGSWTRADYAETIGRGGYPEAIANPERLRGHWFDSYVERILRRDVPDIAPRTEAPRLGTILRLLGAGQAGEYVRSRVGRDADVPETSVATYVDLLETLYLIHRVPAWTPNLTSRQARRPKMIVADSGLALHLAGVDAEQLAPLTGGPLLGPALEGFVVAELLRQRSWSEQRYRIFHFRDRAGAEVDLVLEFSDGCVIGIEVKSNATAKPEHFAGLRLLRDRLGEKFLGGYVLNTGQRGMAFGDRLRTLPVSALWDA